MLPKLIYWPVFLFFRVLEWICEKTGRMIIIKGHPEGGAKEEIYLIRYYLFKPNEKGWNIFIHRFLRSDLDVVHDHPFDFLGLVLSGGYKEVYYDSQLDGEYPFCINSNPPGSFLIRTASHRHKVLVKSVNTWETRRKAPMTVILRGPRYQGWGFYPDGKFVDFETYLDVKSDELHQEAQ